MNYRVLHIVGYLVRGGAETMAMNYYRELVRRGIQFDFVVHKHVSDGYEDEVRKLGGRIWELPPAGSIGMKKYIQLLTDLMKEKGPFQAVHYHMNEQGFMSIIAGRRAGIPVVAMHSHSTKFSTSKAMINRLITIGFRGVRLACGSEAGKAMYGRLPYYIVPNAISMDEFVFYDEEKKSEVKKKFNLESRRIIGHVGRLVDVKNHQFMMEVIKEIINHDKSIAYCIVGDGEKRDALLKKAEELGLVDNVFFLGTQTNMPDMYHMFDLMVLPSFKEGLPCTVIENQASGRLTLCSTGVPKDCDQGIGLVKFLELDPDLWCKEILWSLDHPSDIPNEYDRKKRLSNYDISVQCELLDKIYHNEITG